MYGVDPILIREGGSIPVTAVFEHDLGLPVVLLGFAQPAGNAHAPNEWFLVENFERGTRVIVRLWDELAAASKPAGLRLTACGRYSAVPSGHPRHRVGWTARRKPGARMQPTAIALAEDAKHVTTETGKRPRRPRGASTVRTGAWRPARRSMCSSTSTTR